ncbi:MULTISPECIES: MFS transporter [Geobacter]|uniref:Membrane protein n=2 Tax=Geobacter TaxID=28231 RepID=A0A0C1U7C4_9BACT|nr:MULTISPECIES: MFS transporter [Geobacter]KIE43550.1 membrane protein [Geobacter soli]MBE2888823.1 MFS transporter [Geobacter anodireducens]HMN02072.1 MFS transporter [Geobacter anodireducens]
MIRPAWLTRTSLSWALYDFANTIFSMSVVTLYFPLFLVQTLGYREYWLSLGLSLSMGLAAVASPFVGSASDRRIGKNVILAVATSLCCIATLLIPVPGHLAGVLAAFVAANFLYQVSLVAYDALLPSATDERHYGPVSGFGVALGYIGTFLALIIGKLLVTTPADNGRVFLPTAICFLLFALPCFFVKDLKRSQTSPVRVADTAREIIRDRDLRWYFAGHLLYLDAVNTVIAFMAVFLVKVGGFSQAKGEVNYFLMFSTIFAVIGGLFWGWLVRRRGARTGLLATLALWIAALGMVCLPLAKEHYWILGPLSGIALGGVWACDRPLLLNMVPRERAGSFFGFYYLTGKFSSVVGPLLFGAILALPLGTEAIRYRLAFFSLLIMVIAATACIARIRPKQATPQLQAGGP